jgi:acyl-homoserine-lactone acylase
MPLNIVFADAQHIGWQVSGPLPESPRRVAGCCHHPGWDDRYAWDGFADPMLHPYDQDPPQGLAGHGPTNAAYRPVTACSCPVPGTTRSAPSASPNLAGNGRHDGRSMIAMQYDQTSPFVAKLQAMFKRPAHARLAAPGHRSPARRPARTCRRGADTFAGRFDGKLAASSLSTPPSMAPFLHESARDRSSSMSWARKTARCGRRWWKPPTPPTPAQADHLLGRADSPFWERHPHAAAGRQADHPGPQPWRPASSCWRADWARSSTTGSGASCTPTSGVTDTTRMAPYMSASQRSSINALKGYLDRGPYPAGGDHSTLNVAAYAWGQDFDTFLIPAMRIVVELRRRRTAGRRQQLGPVRQPRQPALCRRHRVMAQGRLHELPFKAENLDKVYGNQRLLLMPAK